MQTDLEIIMELYADPRVDMRAAPFSETEILLEQNRDVQKAMVYVTALLGLKTFGRSRKKLENDKASAYLGKALAKICVAKKWDIDRTVGLINQLYEIDLKPLQ